MELLKIDNKLIALHCTTANTYNITNNLTNSDIIRQIINDGHRFAILTTTSVYYLYYKDDFELVDLTKEIESTVAISDIKFVVNTNNTQYYTQSIGIITTSNEVFFCGIKQNKFESITYNFQLQNNIIAVSNKTFSYIYKLENDVKDNLHVISMDATDSGNKYVIGEYDSCNGNVELCVVDKLPTQFMTSRNFVCGNCLVQCSWCVFSDKMMFSCYRFNNDHTEGSIIMIQGSYGYHKIVLNVQTKIVEFHMVTKTGTSMYNIGHSHYHVESVGQYTNNSFNVKWTPGDHYLFDGYSDKFVVNMLLCNKYGKLRKWIPKGVLYVIIKFALCE